MADDKPVEEHPAGGKLKLDGGRGDTHLKLLDIGSDMEGLNVSELGKAFGFAPGRESGRCLGIGSAGMRVADIGGEELEDAPGRRGVRREQGRQGYAFDA